VLLSPYSHLLPTLGLKNRRLEPTLPIKTPRLIRDKKSGGYFFRYKLPGMLAQQHGKISVYLSLRTKEFDRAKACAHYLNLQLEMSRQKLNANDLKLEDLKELLKIDLKNGIFEADTPEETAQGLKALALMKSMGGAPPIESIGLLDPADVTASLAKRPSLKFSLVVEEYLKDAKLALRPSTLYKHKTTFKHFQDLVGDSPIDSYQKEDIKSFKTKLLGGQKTGHTINQYLRTQWRCQL